MKRRLLLGRRVRQHIKKQRHYFASKGPSSQGYGFSSSHVWMWELDYKAEYRRTDAFELWCWRRLLRVPCTAKKYNHLKVHLKGNQSWILIGRTDAKAETLILWPPDVKKWLIWKDSDAGKDWKWEKGMTDGLMASLTRWTWVWTSSRSWWWTGRPDMLQSMELQSWIPWGHKELDTTEWLNWTDAHSYYLGAFHLIYLSTLIYW